jgi:hypothetical protein
MLPGKSGDRGQTTQVEALRQMNYIIIFIQKSRAVKTLREDLQRDWRRSIILQCQGKS